MSTLQHKQLTFNKNITLANDGGKISSDSGLVLIKEFMNRIGFSSILEEQVKLTDSRRNPDHTYNDIIEQLLLQHIAGYSKDVAANRLRLDPIFKTIFSNKNTLASQPTISRFFQAITKETIPQFMQVAQQLADMQIAQNNIQDMVIDLDSTHSDTYGNQESADFNNHYQTNGYHPLVAFDGLTGMFLGAELRPGNVYTSKNAETFLTNIVTHFSKHPCNMNSMVRGDSGFAKPEIYNFCNENDIRFVIRLKANSRLRSEAERYVLYSDETDFRTHEVQYFFLTYQAASWKNAERVAVRATRDAGSFLFTRFEFVLSNFRNVSPETVFALYQKRGTMENFIKEIKNGFYFDKTDSSTFTENSARMALACISYNLIHLFKKTVLPDSERNSTIATLRFKLIHIGAKVTKHARRIAIHLASSNVYDGLFWTVFQRIQSFKLLI